MPIRTTSIPPSVRPSTSAASSTGEWVRPSRPTAIRLAPCSRRQRGEGPAERISVGLAERVADDAANVIFAQDGGVEAVGHCSVPERIERLRSVQPAVRRLLALRSPGAGNAEPRDHFAQFLPGGDVGDADFAEIGEVEQGQALGEQLAVDDPLAEAGDDPEADPPRQFVERRADAAQIVRIDMLEAVAEHDPVDALAGRSWRAGCGCSRSARHRSSAWSPCKCRD